MEVNKINELKLENNLSSPNIIIYESFDDKIKIKWTIWNFKTVKIELNIKKVEEI
ncbi:hypothetical protein ACOL29_02275 [Aliarcobacter butzleri]